MDIYVKTCDTCAAVKPPVTKPKAATGQMPLDHLAMDFVGLLQNSRPDQKAETCAEVILNEVITQLGCPLSIHSDQGRNFESQVFSELCLMLEIRKTRTTPGNPHCNGQVEHFNKTLIWIIKCFLKGEQDQWDRHLGCLAGAYHRTHHKSTGFSPKLMILGREVRCPMELHFGSTPHEAYSTYGQFVTKLKGTLQHVHKVAQQHLHKSAQRQNILYDGKLQEQQYSPGDLMWFESDRGQFRDNPKLQIPYQGPYVLWRGWE